VKELPSPDPSEPVRNPLETFGKGIVCYIPFKFAFKNLTNTALCQKLPTAYFLTQNAVLFAAQKFATGAKIRQAAARRNRIRISRLCIFAPLVHFYTSANYFNHKQSLINKNELHLSQRR
jgi:hypothetical protein